MKLAMPKPLAGFWQARQPRERRALAVMAAVLALALLGQLLWSAHSGRERLRAELPRLASELAALQAGAEEWRRLAAMPERQAAALSAGQRQEIAASAQALGLAANWREANSLQLKGQASFDAWITWLAQVQQDHALRLLRAQAQAAGPGRVMLEAELGPAAGRDGM